MVDTLKLNNSLISICADQAELGDAAAREFVRILQEVVGKNGVATVALSGGRTPQIMYKRVLQDDLISAVDWSKVHFFVGDERCVSQESTDSNFGNAQRLFLSKLDLPAENLHPLLDPEKDSEASAARYEQTIKDFFRLKDGELPHFDMIQLGMGPDGHCASLFPGTAALNEKKRLVVSNTVEKLKSDRITFTFPTINSARYVMFMVEGAEKAPVLAEALQSISALYPVQRIHPDSGCLMWFIDEQAAGELKLRR